MQTLSRTIRRASFAARAFVVPARADGGGSRHGLAAGESLAVAACPYRRRSPAAFDERQPLAGAQRRAANFDQTGHHGTAYGRVDTKGDGRVTPTGPQALARQLQG